MVYRNLNLKFTGLSVAKKKSKKKKKKKKKKNIVHLVGIFWEKKKNFVLIK